MTRLTLTFSIIFALAVGGCTEVMQTISAASDAIDASEARANAGPTVYGLAHIDGRRVSVTPLFVWSPSRGFTTHETLGVSWTEFYAGLSAVGTGFNLYGDGVRAAAGRVTRQNEGIPPGDGCFGLPDAELQLVGAPMRGFAPRHLSAIRSENPPRMWGSTATDSGVSTFDHMAQTHAGPEWLRIGGPFAKPVGAFFDGVTVLAGAVESTTPDTQGLGTPTRLLVFEVQNDIQNVVLDLSGEGEGYAPLEFVDLTYDGVPELVVDRQIGDEYGEVVVYERTPTAWVERIVVPVFGC